MDKLLLLIPTLSCTIFDFLPGDETSGSYHPVSFLFCGSGTSRFMVCRANHEKAYGHGGYSGRGRVTPSAVILAKRGSPKEGQGGMTPWTRRLTISVIQRPQAVESHGQGLGGVVSLPVRNHPGDSRAERENDSRIWGDSSVAYAPSE